MELEKYRQQAIKVDAGEALALWNAGKSLRQIRDAIAPGASHVAVLRAIRRAVRAGGAAVPHRGSKNDQAV